MLPSDTSPYSPPPSGNALRRSNSNRVIAGVIGGWAAYFDLDPRIMRYGWVLLSLGGGGVMAYLVAWFIMPDEMDQRSAMPAALLIALIALTIGCVACVQIASFLTAGGADSF